MPGRVDMPAKLVCTHTRHAFPRYTTTLHNEARALSSNEKSLTAGVQGAGRHAGLQVTGVLPGAQSRSLRAAMTAANAALREYAVLT